MAVKTGLEETEVNKQILNAVLEQIGVGIWAESTYMQRLTEDLRIENGVDISFGWKFHMSQAQELEWFAKKIYTISRLSMESDYKEKIEERIYGEHRIDPDVVILQRKNGESVEHFKETIELYRKCDELSEKEFSDNPLNFAKFFNEKNENACWYLSSPWKKVTYADAFKVYKALKERAKELEKPLKNMDMEDKENEDYEEDYER